MARVRLQLQALVVGLTLVIAWPVALAWAHVPGITQVMVRLHALVEDHMPARAQVLSVTKPF